MFKSCRGRQVLLDIIQRLDNPHDEIPLWNHLYYSQGKLDGSHICTEWKKWERENISALDHSSRIPVSFSIRWECTHMQRRERQCDIYSEFMPGKLKRTQHICSSGPIAYQQVARRRGNGIKQSEASQPLPATTAIRAHSAQILLKEPLSRYNH